MTTERHDLTEPEPTLRERWAIVVEDGRTATVVGHSRWRRRAIARGHVWRRHGAAVHIERAIVPVIPIGELAYLLGIGAALVVVPLLALVFGR